MKRFTQLFVELDETNKTAEKVAAMERYFREAPARDAAWGLFFLSGLRLKRIAKTSVVHEAALPATGVTEWMLGECYDAVGDLSETIALLLPEGAEWFDEPLHEVVERRIVPLVHADDAKAVGMFLDAWARMSGPERFVLNKLVRGNFRLGVQRALVVRALAQATGVEPGVLTHRLSGDYAPTEEAFRALASPGSERDDAARPYPFCLAYQLDVGLKELGEACDWQVEFKWDGTRAQIVRRAGISGSGVAMWSRGEEAIAEQFPEIARAAERLPPGTVLDGEVLAWRFEGVSGDRGGRPLSFNALQTRLNRKDVHPTLFDEEGVVFAAFDILEHEGRDVRGLALRERRGLLDGVMREVQMGTAGVLRVPPVLKCPTWEEVRGFQRDAREVHGAEGVMLKHVGSRYHVGRIAGGTAATTRGDGGAEAGWWKWKVNPLAVDAVLMYAQQGSGRRAGLFTDYTFGVWDPEAGGAGEGGALTPFAKAYSGLTNEEIKKVDAFIRANTLERAGPVRMVRPELVFEISFEAIQASTRHRSGVAVRFPRITRWRTDKLAKDADTIGTVRALLEAARVRDAMPGRSGSRGGQADST